MLCLLLVSTIVVNRDFQADIVVQLFNHTPSHKVSSGIEQEDKSCASDYLLLESITWRSTRRHSPSAISPLKARLSLVWLM
jgi:hypothetical protein